MEQIEGEYHFSLFGDLGPGLAKSSLGIIYPKSVANETEKALTEVSETFSQRLDPLAPAGPGGGVDRHCEQTERAAREQPREKGSARVAIF